MLFLELEVLHLRIKDMYVETFRYFSSHFLQFKLLEKTSNLLAKHGLIL